MSKFSSDINYLRQYVNGELSPTEMYEIERAMHDDEMLMDIIEGLDTEKFLKSSPPTAALHDQIEIIVTKHSKAKVFNLKKYFVAASIIALFTIGGIYFIYNDSPATRVGDESITFEPHDSENNSVIPEIADSSLVVFSGKDSITKENTLVQNQDKSSKVVSTEPIAKKKLLVYQAKPKMQVVIEGPKYLNKDEAEVIELTPRSETKNPQTELLTAKVGTGTPTPNTNIAKTQADLQRLDLDPQTKANLSAVLSRQTIENKVDLKEKQSENTLSEVLITGNSLASKKHGNARIVSSSDGIDALVTKPIQNGSPSCGWATFNVYMKVQLNKKGFTTYNVNISFDLDAQMKPTNIEIKTSSNPKLNAVIIDILKNGPTWENKDPNHPTFIRINSEEAQK